MDEETYKQKYLKYKQKYFKLQAQLGGFEPKRQGKIIKNIPITHLKQTMIRDINNNNIIKCFVIIGKEDGKGNKYYFVRKSDSGNLWWYFELHVTNDDGQNINVVLPEDADTSKTLLEIYDAQYNYNTEHNRMTQIISKSNPQKIIQSFAEAVNVLKLQVATSVHKIIHPTQRPKTSQQSVKIGN